MGATVASAGKRRLSRYYFDIRWPDREHDDPHGTALPNDEAAYEYAIRAIRELKGGGGYDEPGLKMVVRNADDKSIFSIPF
jgi:hypothetical protein